jgi:tetratricopeptide (TPR) repeat protein
VKTARLLCPLTLALLAACNGDPQAAARKYVASGNRYFAHRQYKEASILYRRALAKHLRSPDAWYGLGLVNVILGDLPEARRDFSRVMELNPANQDAIVQVGDLDLAFYLLDPPSGRTFLADLKEIAERLLKQDSRSFDGLRFAGNIALASNDTSGAIAKFQQANLVKPGQPDLTLTLVQTLFAAQRDQEGESLAAAELDRQKAFAPLYDALYVHYMRSNRPELAEQILQRRIANNPMQADCVVQLALHYFLLHRAAEAREEIAHLTSNAKTFPLGRLEAGDFYVRIHDYPAALAEYQAGERQNSRQTRLYRKKRAEVLATLGEREQAAKIVAGLLKDNASDPEALALQATLLLASGDSRQVEAAIAELQPLVAKMPRNATLRFDLGQAYLALVNEKHSAEQNRDRAREQFEAALRLDPHHAPAKLAWAELALARGEWGRAVEAASEVLNEDSTNVTARIVRAGAFVNMAEGKKAREDLAAALLVDPASQGPASSAGPASSEDPAFRDAREQLAELDFRERRYREAEAGFRGLIALGDSRAVEGLLKTEIAQGEFQEAIQFASDQVRRWPDRGGTRFALAECLIAAGSYTAAATQFQMLIDKNRGSAELYLQMGEAKLHGGDIPGALAAFQAARQLAPADARPVLDLALLYDRLGRSQQAHQEYESVIRLQPENPTALNNLAYLEAEEGVDLDRALAQAQRAQQKLPGDLDVQDTLALVYIRENLTNAGIRLLRDLVSRRPDSAAFHLHLAMAFYQKGERFLARRELEAALQHQPTAKEQNRIRELLAKVG